MNRLARGMCPQSPIWATCSTVQRDSINPLDHGILPGSPICSTCSAVHLTSINTLNHGIRLGSLTCSGCSAVHGGSISPLDPGTRQGSRICSPCSPTPRPSINPLDPGILRGSLICSTCSSLQRPSINPLDHGILRWSPIWSTCSTLRRPSINPLDPGTRQGSQICSTCSTVRQTSINPLDPGIRLGSRICSTCSSMRTTSINPLDPGILRGSPICSTCSTGRLTSINPLDPGIRLGSLICGTCSRVPKHSASHCRLGTPQILSMSLEDLKVLRHLSSHHAQQETFQRTTVLAVRLAPQADGREKVPYNAMVAHRTPSQRVIKVGARTVLLHSLPLMVQTIAQHAICHGFWWMFIVFGGICPFWCSLSLPWLCLVTYFISWAGACTQWAGWGQCLRHFHLIYDLNVMLFCCLEWMPVYIGLRRPPWHVVKRHVYTTGHQCTLENSWHKCRCVHRYLAVRALSLCKFSSPNKSASLRISCLPSQVTTMMPQWKHVPSLLPPRCLEKCRMIDMLWTP